MGPPIAKSKNKGKLAQEIREDTQKVGTDRLLPAGLAIPISQLVASDPRQLVRPKPHQTAAKVCTSTEPLYLLAFVEPVAQKMQV